MEQWWIFTFYQKSNLANYFVKFYGTYSEARNKMTKEFGSQWAFMHDEKNGLEFVKKHSLKELT